VLTDDRITAFPPADFWRSLNYFNLYRLALATIFVALSGVFRHVLSLGPNSSKIFIATSIIYLLAALISFVPLKLRWPRFTVQLAGQVGVDILAFTLLAFASGGIQSSIGLLLLVSLAAAGLISRGMITMFFAALASIATLLEHTFEVLYAKADAALYLQVGLLCMAYFAVAWLAHTLARYAVDSQLLAQRRGRDLVSLAEANRLVMRDMHDGVLVVDGEGMIMQMNLHAERLLHKAATTEGLLSDNFPLLYGQYALWKQTGATNRDVLQLDEGLQARLRFVAIERDATHGAVIFLEDMQRMRAEAQQIKLAALGRLTANIAHEVRNPLSAISYAAELMQEELADSKQKRLVQIVLENTNRINQIVQDVMQLNRRDRAQTETFELDGMLRTFIDEYVMAERVEPGVIVHSGVKGVTVSFDRGQLRQVLWNLCSNALRYGSGSPGSLELISDIDEGKGVLSVQDDGPGISQEDQGKLFEPFFTTAAEGTGLGLYIAKELCEANGSRLEYCADAGQQGACFKILFGDNYMDGERRGHGG